MINHYDAIIVLGGGRNAKGLTSLSTKRLDKGWELFQQGKASKIFALGGLYSTYMEDAIRFPNTGAELRRDYLLNKGKVNLEDITMVEDGRDTIYEAFACRKKAKELGLKSFLLVTSEKHMKRALFLFERIFGKELIINGGSETSALTGDVLLEDEEKAYLALWKEAFNQLPEDIPDPVSWEEWYSKNLNYYLRHRKIHDEFHPPGGKESQAYTGRNNEKI